MYQRDDDRSIQPGQPRPRAAPPRRVPNPVLALQRAIGNRGTTRVLARDKRAKGKGTYQNSVQIGAVGPIEITGGNLADWAARKGIPDDLTVTSTKGKHSDGLKRLSDDRKRFEKINVQAITGENSWMIIAFKNARVVGYSADDAGKTESWKLVDFDGVHRESTSIGVPRP
jgi:hypothetical protein